MNNQKKWEVLGKLKKKDIIGVLLKNRGIKNKKEFFNPTPPEKISVKSLSLSRGEIDKAIERIKKAKQNKEKVIVYGDYDADGICGTAILWETLYSLGLDVLPYIPERFSEGYGLNIDSLRKLKTENPDLGLIITVDHGIVAHKKIDIAGELGIDVIITDHHQPRTALTSSRGLRPRVGGASVRGRPVYQYPKAFAVIHTTKIGGAAVAWVLSREILRKIQNTRYKILNTLELVAIGTIADQLPLLGPNRSFAKYGLVALNKTKRLGLVELMKTAGLEVGLAPRSVYEVGFLIAPRLNAMGRLEHAMESLRLLCIKSPSRAKELAQHLNKTNLERQKIVEEVVVHARRLAQGESSEGVIVIASESYHEGVIGLAAGKLVEEFYRPAIVLSKKKNISKASARSISGFNIIEVIRRLEGLYIEGGGHPMAAGFSIETTKIKQFTKRINKISQPLLTKEILRKKLKIDLELPFNQLNRKLLEVVRSFEPTGLGNPAPTFLTRKVAISDARVVGREGKHLKLRLEKDGAFFDAIAFGAGALFKNLTPEAKIDAAYSLEEDSWGGIRRLQLKVKDVKISG